MFMSSSKKTKTASKAVKEAPKKTEWNNIYKTTYYFWRFWLKDLLIKGKIKKYRFVKDEVGYTGHIAIDKPEVEAAHKVLADYKTKNPDIKDMWW
jgi:hypothetical protein